MKTIDTSPKIEKAVEGFLKESKKKKKTVEQILREMGRTPGQVAETLEAVGIKGKTRDGGKCPVARYLKQRLKGIWLVGRKTITRFKADDSTTYAVPKPVSQFIASFDMGNYPKLITKDVLWSRHL